jgi:hypothetical protein
MLALNVEQHKFRGTSKSVDHRLISFTGKHFRCASSNYLENLSKAPLQHRVVHIYNGVQSAYTAAIELLEVFSTIFSEAGGCD